MSTTSKTSVHLTLRFSGINEDSLIIKFIEDVELPIVIER